MDWSLPGFPTLHYTQNLLKLMSIESVMPSNHLILCCLLLLPPSIFPSIRILLMSLLIASGGQSTGVSASASASVLAMNIQDWFPLGWTGWISPKSKGLSRVPSNTTVQKHLFFSFLYSPTLTSIHGYRLDRPLLIMSLLFTMLSRLLIAFLSRSKLLLISWLQSPSAVILECRKIKSATVSTVSPSICH